MISSWEIGKDAEEIHGLLCACDSYTATLQAPAPHRDIATTQHRVRDQVVHVLRLGSDAAATFVLSWQPPFSQAPAIFPRARKPAYISRLAVHPQFLAEGTLLGARCIRKAIEFAEAQGADVLRSEANPDLSGVLKLLLLHKFEEYFRTQGADGRRRIYLQKSLGPKGPLISSTTEPAEGCSVPPAATTE